MEEQRPSALAGFGITQWPIGTKQEIIDAGYDPAKVASCCDGKDGSRPCPVWDGCRFNRQAMGGFKGSGGPHYIGYRYIDPATGDATQDITRCHAYVLTLQAQGDAGAAERRVTGGKRGKIVKVIAQEGQQIKTRYQLPINGKGQVINPMPEIVPILEANQIAHSLLPNEVAVTWRFFELMREVPKHPRPGELAGDSYAHRIALLDAEEGNDYADEWDSNAPATEMPVLPKRGPGRPPKAPVATPVEPA